EVCTAGYACRGPRQVGGQERITREKMFDVREHQLLMLLLVVDSQLDDSLRCDRLGTRQATQKPGNLRIDCVAVFKNLRHGWTREQAAPRTRKLIADAVVVRVEEDLVVRMERPMVRFPARQYERFKEPRSVR